MKREHPYICIVWGQTDQSHRSLKQSGIWKTSIQFLASVGSSVPYVKRNSRAMSVHLLLHHLLSTICILKHMHLRDFKWCRIYQIKDQLNHTSNVYYLQHCILFCFFIGSMEKSKTFFLVIMCRNITRLKDFHYKVYFSDFRSFL